MTASRLNEDTSNIDTTRGNILTDIQAPTDSVPMPSTTTQMALNDRTRNELTDLLERPVNLGTFEWRTTTKPIPIQLKPSDYDADTVTHLQKFDFPQVIFQNSHLVVDKLKNYQYFKANVEIEIKVNAQPFLQGALLLVHNPYLEQVGDFRRKGTKYLASQTSCPHRILNLENSNSLKMTIPYANIYDLFDLGNSDNQFGTVYLYVLSTLRGVGTDEVAKYTVFARFINPEYYVPTHNDVLSTFRDAHDTARLEQRGYRVRSRRYAQSSVAPVAASDTGEIFTSGPIASTSATVATVAGALAGVPLIGNVAASVAWAARAAQNLAITFGWSKPVSLVPKHTLKPNSTLIHTEGQDDSTTLALLQDNGIDGSSFIPETKDEMALSYLLKRPNYFHAQTANTTLFSGRKKITAWEVSPLSEYQYGNAEDSQSLYLGAFAYTSMMATLWRGNIIYDIEIIKTCFHQGRFMIVFLPETNLADVPETLSELPNTNHSVVCNLKEDDDSGRTHFRVSVPFISNTPWRETYKRSTNETNPGPDAKTLDTKTGCIALYALVDLSSPPTVADDVTFYVAHSAGDDYQLARPVIQLAPGFQDRYAQSDIGTLIIPEDENLLVQSHTSADVTAQTTGEYFHSLRALIKRFGYFANIKSQDDYVGLVTRQFNENIFSGAREMSRLNFNDSVIPTPFYMASFLFRFYNGSSLLKIIPFTPGVTVDAFLTYDEDRTAQVVTPVSHSYGAPVFTQLQQVSNSFEVRTPYYRAIRADVVNSQLKPVFGDVRTNLRCRNLANYGGEQPSPLFEAAGDDFSFFYAIGPPVMCDIRNVTKVSTFPTGTQVEVNFADITGATTDPLQIIVSGVAYEPFVSPTGTFKIADSTQKFIPVTYSNPSPAPPTIVEVPITSCSFTSTQFFIPRDPTKTFDSAATVTALKALLSFTATTNAVILP